MATYRFLNAAHTLVLRDDHVIPWDPKTNSPAPNVPGPPTPSSAPPLQPVRRPPNEIAEPFDNRDHQARASLLGAKPEIAPADETQLWHAVGSPQPAEYGKGAAARVLGADELDWQAGTEPMLTRPPIEEADGLGTALDHVEEALPQCNDVAALRAQVEELTHVVHRICGGPPMDYWRPKP